MKYDLLELYEKTLKGPWKTVGSLTQYKLIGDEHILCLCFKNSDHELSYKEKIKVYKNNLTNWYSCKSIVEEWQNAKIQIEEDVLKTLGNKKLIIMGNSYGASLTILAHEYFWFNNLNPLSFSFFPKQIVWFPTNSIKKRFKDLFTIINRTQKTNQIYPILKGYRHVGNKKYYGKSFLLFKRKKMKDVLKDQYIEV